jgi:tetratricopeptide (TPR) repeat protein
MIEVGATDVLDKISLYWHKKLGLVLVFLLEWGLLIAITSNLKSESTLSTYFFESLAFIFFITSIFWLFSTNRILLRKGCDLVLAVMIMVDEDDEINTLVKISKNTIEKFKDRDEYKNIKIIFLPANYLSSIQKVKKYISANSNALDIFIVLHTHSGNMQNDLKIEIKNFEFIHNLQNVPVQKSLLLEKINFIEEIRIQNFHKKWAILNSNSFEDRSVIKNNFEDMLLHTIAIQYLILGKNESSLAILNKMLKIEKLKIPIPNSPTAKINIKPQVVSQSRILFLLTTLYLAISEDFMYSNPKKTLTYLTELENIIPGYTHKYSFLQFVRMARMHYECGNLSQAIYYTRKAEKLHPKNPTININNVFFGIIDRNWDTICNNLKTILHNRKALKYIIIDVLDFLNNEKPKHPGLHLEFDYVICSYEIIFLNQKESQHILKNILIELQKQAIPEKVIHLAQRIIATG